MHPSALEFGTKFFDTYCKGFSGIVVDIGSQNVNGSLKDVCPAEAEYIGVDFCPGNGVDIILTDPYKLPFDDESVDVIVCSSVFEHSQFFWVIFLEIMRVLKPTGLLYLNVPSNGYIHRYPVDCWRFYPDSGLALVTWAERNSLTPALLESFIAERNYQSNEPDDLAWNDYVAVFIKDCKFQDHYKNRVLQSIENYANAYCDDGAIDTKAKFLTNDLLIISKKNEELNIINQTVAERDAHIEGLNQTVADRDAHIENLNQTVADRDAHIENLNQTLTKINDQVKELRESVTELDQRHQEILSQVWSSSSWRLTRPLRSTVIKTRRLLHITKLLPQIVKHGSGITQTVSKAFRIYRNDGINGIRRTLIMMPQLALSANPINVEVKTKSSPANKHEIPRIDFDQTENRYIEYRKNPPIKPLVKLIAFYLPQFHPFPENDEWWGKGFTEWTNVGKAKPNFVDHYQPHCPIHNGYYDLRIPEVMQEQAKLAKEYGIYGFNYYFYWFGGKILMDTPLENMLKNKSIDMPFCLTWANENWSRRWDGQENDILIAQNHSDEDSLAFIRHLIKYFKDERYIRIDGKPVLTIYRANIIPDMAATAKIWRDEMLKHDIPGIYLISAQTFGIRSPEQFGFDASMEFPPHTIISQEITNEINLINENYNGLIYSYEQVVANAVLSKEPNFKLFRTAMLSWDNTARKQNQSHIFHNFSLLRYKQWLSSIVNKVHNNAKYSSDEKIVFVNAWNEWAEGTHLEPDQKFGYGYLQTTYDVLKNYDSLPVTIKRDIKRKNEYAVILHLHYEELWPYIRDYLTRSHNKDEYDLFVSVTSSSVIKKIQDDFPNAYIELVENRGRDTLPFLRMLNLIKNVGYLAVCKIHSKRSVYRNDGDVIRDEIYDALMGSKEQVQNILARFKSNVRLGLIAPKKYLIEHNEHNMTFDKEVVSELSRHLKINFTYDVFPAGSMFWFKPESLLLLNTIDDSFFEIESGLADGECAHAIERLFCSIVKDSNFMVVGV